jgi:hypothetical protein
MKRLCFEEVPSGMLAWTSFLTTIILLWTANLLPAQELLGPPKPVRSFKEESIFLGIAKKGEVLIALHLREQEWTGDRLRIRAVLVPTDKFPFESGYRGFQKIERSRVKKGEDLRLYFEAGAANFDIGHHVDIGDTLPIAIDALSSDRRGFFVPEDITKVEFKVRDVARWEKVPRKDLPMWSRTFEALEAGDRGVDSGPDRKAVARGKILERADQIDPEEYRGRYATLNGTYIFEKKTVYSPIVGVLEIGEYVEHSKSAGGGWMEVLFGEEKMKGYVLAVYLVDDAEEATRWEQEKGIRPVVPPLGRTAVENEEERQLDEP